MLVKIALTAIVVCGLIATKGHQRFESSGSDKAIIVALGVTNSVDQPYVGFYGIGAEWLILVPATEFPQTTNEDYRDLKVMHDVLTNSAHPP